MTLHLTFPPKPDHHQLIHHAGCEISEKISAVCTCGAAQAREREWDASAAGRAFSEYEDAWNRWAYRGGDILWNKIDAARAEFLRLVRGW